jgi:FtsZ-interacting cell division protein ZipA
MNKKILSIIGIIIIVMILGLFFWNINRKEEVQETTAINSVNKEAENQKCDAENSKYTAFNGIEKVIVSNKPCEVMWLLAKESERYTLKTKKGTELEVIVWHNQSNNVKASESYTIRALDVEDTNETRSNANISVVRWVSDKSSLPKAKNELKKVIENLEF